MSGPLVERAVPSFQVKVRGIPLGPDATADLISASVHQDTALPGMFTIRLWNWDLVRPGMTWSDSPVFEPGVPVQIEMGYVGALRDVFNGEITGLELEYDAADAPTVLVRGYDLRHRLMRGQLTRSFVKATDSAIARRIASERGLQPVVTETRVVFDHVLQHNQTDLDFLAGRAALIGYELAVEDRTLYFRPRVRHRVATVTLHREDLISFHQRLTTMGQTSGVAVQGRDPAAPATQIRAVSGNDDPNARGAPAVRDDPVQAAYRLGTATTMRVLASRAEAGAIAAAHRDATDPWRITGSGSCIGRPDLRAGDLVRIEGMGRRFSGDYVVTAATHSVHPSTGYTTAFDVRKDQA
jgi:phage protein D